MLLTWLEILLPAIIHLFIHSLTTISEAAEVKSWTFDCDIPMIEKLPRLLAARLKHTQGSQKMPSSPDTGDTSQTSLTKSQRALIKAHTFGTSKTYLSVSER